MNTVPDATADPADKVPVARLKEFRRRRANKGQVRSLPQLDRGFRVFAVTSVGQMTLPIEVRSRWGLGRDGRATVALSDLGDFVLLRDRVGDGVDARVTRSGQLTLPAEIRKRWKAMSGRPEGEAQEVEMADLGDAVIVAPGGASGTILRELYGPCEVTLPRIGSASTRERVLLSPEVLLAVASEGHGFPIPAWCETFVTLRDFGDLQHLFLQRQGAPERIASLYDALGDPERARHAVASSVCALETLARAVKSEHPIAMAQIQGRAAASLAELSWSCNISPREAEVALACFALDADYFASAGELSPELLELLGTERCFEASLRLEVAQSLG